MCVIPLVLPLLTVRLLRFEVLHAWVISEVCKWISTLFHRQHDILKEQDWIYIVIIVVSL